MDPLNSYAPLFEAKFELDSLNLYFVPSIEPQINGNFISLIQEIIENVMNMTTLIPKIYNENVCQDYKVRLLIIYSILNYKKVNSPCMILYRMKSNVMSI